MSGVDCAQAMANLHDYLKRELTPELADELRQHLDHCRDCFHHARFEANFLIMLETRGSRPTCPKEVRARILNMLRAESGGD